MVNEQFTLIGYKLSTWFIENKDDIKNTITVISGIVAAAYPEAIWAKILFAAGTGLVSKWLLDIIDYYCKK